MSCSLIDMVNSDGSTVDNIVILSPRECHRMTRGISLESFHGLHMGSGLTEVTVGLDGIFQPTAFLRVGYRVTLQRSEVTNFLVPYVQEGDKRLGPRIS